MFNLHGMVWSGTSTPSSTVSKRPSFNKTRTPTTPARPVSAPTPARRSHGSLSPQKQRSPEKVRILAEIGGVPPTDPDAHISGFSRRANEQAGKLFERVRGTYASASDADAAFDVAASHQLQAKLIQQTFETRFHDVQHILDSYKDDETDAGAHTSRTEDDNYDITNHNTTTSLEAAIRAHRTRESALRRLMKHKQRLANRGLLRSERHSDDDDDESFGGGGGRDDEGAYNPPLRPRTALPATHRPYLYQDITEHRARWAQVHTERVQRAVEEARLIQEEFQQQTREKIAARVARHDTLVKARQAEAPKIDLRKRYRQMAWAIAVVHSTAMDMWHRALIKAWERQRKRAELELAMRRIAMIMRVFLLKRRLKKRYRARKTMMVCLMHWVTKSRLRLKNRAADLLRDALQRTSRVSHMLHQYRARRRAIMTIQVFWRMHRKVHELRVDRLLRFWKQMERIRHQRNEREREQLRAQLAAIQEDLRKFEGATLKGATLKKVTTLNKARLAIEANALFQSARQRSSVPLSIIYEIIEQYLKSRHAGHHAQVQQLEREPDRGRAWPLVMRAVPSEAILLQMIEEGCRRAVEAGDALDDDLPSVVRTSSSVPSTPKHPLTSARSGGTATPGRPPP